jgi:hypothetical protein
VLEPTNGVVAVLPGNGDGTFRAGAEYTTGGSPFPVRVADLDGDGRLDMVVANYGSRSVSVLLGAKAAGSSTVSTPTSAPSRNRRRSRTWTGTGGRMWWPWIAMRSRC